MEHGYDAKALVNDCNGYRHVVWRVMSCVSVDQVFNYLYIGYIETWKDRLIFSLTPSIISVYINPLEGRATHLNVLVGISSCQGPWSMASYRRLDANQCCPADQWSVSSPSRSQILMSVHSARGGGEMVCPTLWPADLQDSHQGNEIPPPWSGHHGPQQCTMESGGGGCAG